MPFFSTQFLKSIWLGGCRLFLIWLGKKLVINPLRPPGPFLDPKLIILINFNLIDFFLDKFSVLCLCFFM